jgi:hypothetical protein
MLRIIILLPILGALAGSDLVAPAPEHSPPVARTLEREPRLATLIGADHLTVGLRSIGCYHHFQAELRLWRGSDGRLMVSAQTQSLWGEKVGRLEAQAITPQQEADLEAALSSLRGPPLNPFCRTHTTYQLAWGLKSVASSAETIADTDCRGVGLREPSDRIPLTLLWIASRALLGESLAE